MIIKIVDKHKKGEHGEWKPLDQCPQKVLLEADNGNGEPSGKPAIKVNNIVFHFGQKPENVKNYRVLAVGTVVVCIQE